jgi:hypothetical protein
VAEPSLPESVPAPETEPSAPAEPPAPAPEPKPEAQPAEPAQTEDEQPPEIADLVTLLSRAETRDDIADAILDASREHMRRAALFIAQADRVLGWAAKPEAPEGLRAFSLPYSEPSMFASLRNTEGFYVGPCPELSGNRKTLEAIGSSGPSTIAVVPVTLKGKSILFLFGETGAGEPPPSIPSLKRLASMTATTLEIVLLKNRLRNS